MGRCKFTIDVQRRRRVCANALARDFPDIYGNVDLSEIEVFDDLDTDPEGQWRCPRSVSDGDRCVLHDGGSSDEEIRSAIYERLQSDSHSEALCLDETSTKPETAARQFLGVDVKRIDLRGWQSASDDRSPIDLRFANVGRLELADASVTHPIYLDDAQIGEIDGSGLDIDATVRARYASIEGSVTLTEGAVDGRFDVRFSDIGSDVDLRYVDSEGRFDFGFTAIDGDIDAVKASCGGRFTLKEASVACVSASDVHVFGPDPESDIPGLQFRGLRTDGDVSIDGAECIGQLIAYKMEIGGTFDASESRITEGVSMGTRTGTKLPEAEIVGSVSFADAEIGDEFMMTGRNENETNPTVGGKLDLSGAEIDLLDVAPAITHDDLSVVDCRDTTIHEGRLGQPRDASPIIYDLEQAELGDVRIDSKNKPVPQHLWVNCTSFEEFKFRGEERREFANNDWKLIDDNPDLHEAVAHSRVFGEAADYAADLTAICTSQPEIREWLVTTAPPYDPAELARRLFQRVTEATVDRIAKNGPENPEQLGVALFRRERYRTGVVTLLARWNRDGGEEQKSALSGVFDSDSGLEQSQAVATLLRECSHELRVVARCAVELADDSERVLREVGDLSTSKPASLRDAQWEVRDGIADQLAARSDVSLTIEQREITYINARKGADDVGDNNAASHFFVNEMQTRRQRHKREGDYRRYVSNLLFDFIAGYGERPARVIRSSALCVALFAAGYWALWQVYPSFSSHIYDGVAGALLLSFASFSAFVLGGANVTVRPIRLLANIEAFVGAFLIALFVFTLTRSLHR